MANIYDLANDAIRLAEGTIAENKHLHLMLDQCNAALKRAIELLQKESDKAPPPAVMMFLKFLLRDHNVTINNETRDEVEQWMKRQCK